MSALSWTACARLFAVVGLLACGNSLAQSQTTLLSTVHTVAAATVGVPVEENFQVSAAGTYQVKLTDLGAQLSTPAALSSITAAVSNGSATVGTPFIADTSGSQTGVYRMQFSATAAGSYVIHVVGTPGTVPGSGPIGLLVTNVADDSQVAAFSDTLALPSSTTVTNVGVLNDTFTITTAGSYQVTLSDLQLPQALTTLQLAITSPGGGSLLTTLATSPGSPTASASVSLQPGTYDIFAAGQACPPGSTTQQPCTIIDAGLYGVSVSPAGGGALLYSNAIPVGAVATVASPALAAGSYTFRLADLTFPGALANVGAAVTLGGQSVAQLTATGTQTLTATASTYQVFAFGVPKTSGEGSYTVTLQPSTGAPVVSVARAVTVAGGPAYAYNYDTTTVGGETYALSLADFSFPVPFSALSVVAVQNGAVLGSAVNPANSPQNISPVAGPVTLLVFAQSATSGGLFGLNLTANGAGSAAFETTQGVGQPFHADKVSVTTGGNYQVNVSDLGFPTPLANLAVLVTRGTSILGSAFTAGSFNFQATGGDYFVNFLAQPQGAYQAGTYAITVATAPPAPTVTLQSSAASVTSGGTVTLTWSSQNTTSCTASGGWSGSQTTAGTATSPAITANTTFTLTCTGSGGNAANSVTVNIATSSSSSSHGGGAVGPGMIALLLGLVLLRIGAGRLGVLSGRHTPGAGYPC